MPSNENAKKTHFFFPLETLWHLVHFKVKQNKIANSHCVPNWLFVRCASDGSWEKKKKRKIYGIHTVTGTNHSIQFISSCVDRNKNMKNIKVASLLSVHFFLLLIRQLNQTADREEILIVNWGHSWFHCTSVWNGAGIGLLTLSLSISLSKFAIRRTEQVCVCLQVKKGVRWINDDEGEIRNYNKSQ